MDLKKKKKLKIQYVITVVVVYLLSFILVNVGFYWQIWYTYYTSHTEDEELGSVFRTAFYLFVAAICILYLFIVLLVAGLVLQCLEHPILMSILSVVAGVLYPIAGVLIVVGSLYARAKFGYLSGYAVIITNIGGANMLFCYFMVRMYRKIFKKKEGPDGDVFAHLTVVYKILLKQLVPA